MGIVVVANLKGGVGKTSLAVNVSHALSKRFCETLLVDLDPQADATAFLQAENPEQESELPNSQEELEPESILELCSQTITEARESLELLPDSKALQAAKKKGLIQPLLKELTYSYDTVMVDTAPAWTKTLGQLLPIANLLVIPVDPSEMSVRAAIKLLQKSAQQRQCPTLLLRTLVNKRASRINRYTDARLRKNFEDGEREVLDQEIAPPKKVRLRGAPNNPKAPIFLSNSAIYRSELTQKMSFQRKTVFENKELASLQAGYMTVAKEVEQILATDQRGMGSSSAEGILKLTSKVA